jgi:transcriptional regulator with XRE-family HTH domain
MSLTHELDELLAFDNSEDQLEHEAQMLVFQFLGRLDGSMAEKKISKKALAAKVGTSPAFITQLFRGDRRPNWTMLIKMQQILDVKFVVCTEEELEGQKRHYLEEYHHKWQTSRDFEKQKGYNETMAILALEQSDYALAG